MAELNRTAGRTDTAMPRWTWDELRAVLMEFAVSDVQRDMVEPLVSATRKQARFLPPRHVLKEILAITYVVGDEDFSAEPWEGTRMT